MASRESTQPAPFPPERFVAEVFSELDEGTIRSRWQHLNVVLRLSMLSGLQMQLEATLSLLCDMAAEIAPFDRALVYFWDEGAEHMDLSISPQVRRHYVFDKRIEQVTENLDSGQRTVSDCPLH